MAREHRNYERDPGLLRHNAEQQRERREEAEEDARMARQEMREAYTLLHTVQGTHQLRMRNIERTQTIMRVSVLCVAGALAVCAVAMWLHATAPWRNLALSLALLLM